MNRTENKISINVKKQIKFIQLSIIKRQRTGKSTFKILAIIYNRTKY